MINPKLNQIPIAPAANAPAQARSLTESVMKSFSASKRTASLQQTLAAPATRQRLRKYSITTLEEAIGIARVKPAALSQVVSPETVEALRSDDARREAAEFSEIARLLPDFEKRPHAFGARLGASAPPNLFGALEQDARTAPPPAVPELSLVGDACMPPIRNQGQRGTCVAFTTAALAEDELCRRTGNKHDFSEQFHYWNCKCNDGLLPPYTSDGTNDDFAGGGYFIVRNSWGTQWASRSLIAPGYGTIPYDYIRNENESAFVISY